MDLVQEWVLGFNFHDHFPSSLKQEGNQRCFQARSSPLLLKPGFRYRQHRLMLTKQQVCGGAFAKPQAPGSVESFGRMRNLPRLDMFVFQFWPWLIKRKNKWESQKCEKNLTLLKALDMISAWGSNSKNSSKILLALFCLYITCAGSNSPKFKIAMTKRASL